MPLLGAHMSVAGGFRKAVDSAAAYGMDTVQIFTHSPSQWAVKPVAPAGKELLRDGKSWTKINSQWRGKPIADEEIQRFQTALAESSLVSPISHASYLINLASPDRGLWKKSVAALAVELQRAEQLGLAFVVVHPGASMTGTERAGVRRVINALNEVHRQTEKLAVRCLLENTAGQGSSLGWQFEQLAAMLSGVQQPDRFGVCIDTCHAFAAGYPLRTRDEYAATVKTIADTIGLRHVHAIHLNDSKRELGSRVDRHEHIGRGCLGLDPFAHLLNDPRFLTTPMYLETPKGRDPATGEEWDAINLRALRAAVGNEPQR